MTVISASTLRASIDNSTDLPTPEPAKMPSRWPRQQVRKVLSARTPRSSGRPTRLRECAGGGALRNGVGDDGAATAPDPLEAGERHHHGIVPGEADHLGGDGTGATGLDHDPRTDRHRMDGP